jgi:transcriptional regulator with GAF, ATPase, and Fis domain
MTSSPSLDEAASAFTKLAELVYGGSSYDEVFTEICRAALTVVPGCDRACITTLKEGQEPVLEATTDELAAYVDKLEWETGEGPCVDAILTQRFEWDRDITTRPTWPKLAERILQETPVRGMIGYRIVVDDHKIGALNMFSDTAGAFTQEAADMGAILVSFASVALTAASQREETTSLRQGMASNREIGKAMGMLMATHGLTDEKAFQRLRDASNRLNTRLADLAAELVAEHRRSVEETA